MKITRRQLKQLISETIYVNPQGDAFDNRRNDPTKPHEKAGHERQEKIRFLKSQSDERLRKFAPDETQGEIDFYDKSEDPHINQGVELANLVGDQGEFQGMEFTDDELDLRDFADKEFKDMMASTGYDPKHTVTQKTLHFPVTDYYEQFDRIEHQMSLRAEKVLKTNPRAKYFDVIDVLEEVPSYERLMRIISNQYGDFSPIMKRLKQIPEKVANQHGVYF
jgi:hypothetical protein